MPAGRGAGRSSGRGSGRSAGGGGRGSAGGGGGLDAGALGGLLGLQEGSGMCSRQNCFSRHVPDALK